MPLTLENPFLQLHIDPADLCWSIYSRPHERTNFENIRMKIAYRPGNSHSLKTHEFRKPAHVYTTTADSPLGRLNQAILIDSAPDLGLKFRLSFALPDQTPCLLWKLEAENLGSQPVRIGQIELFGLDDRARKIQGKPARFSFGTDPISAPNLAFFSNGWQSWNYTGVYGPQDRYRFTRLGPITAPMRGPSARRCPKTPGHLVSDMFAVLGDRVSRVGALIGFLSQQQHFGTIETRLRGELSDLNMWANGDGARLDPAQMMSTDWAYLSFIDLNDLDPLGTYFEVVARQHGLLPPISDDHPEDLADSWPAAPTGWCSWYDFYGKVSSADIRRNLQAAARIADRLPLEVIQIDDGFQTKTGDWFSLRPSFPEGMTPLAEEIHASGYTPGLWLAPFILLPSSKVAASHPEWLLRGRFNRPVNAGFSTWGGFSTALDLTHPDALKYAQEVVHTAAYRWGFPYLKLDFLYAGALPGRHQDQTQTRAQILRKGLQALRSCLDPKITLLGCGCPLGPAIGLIDAMRIGADVSERWKPAVAGLELFLAAEPDLPSTRNALQNILTRSGMHQRWWINDPDCLLVRPATRMTLAELQTLATAIALSGGSLFLSDDLPDLPEERIQLAARLLPPLPGRMRVIDWFDSTTPARLRLDLHNQTGEWSLLALFNWQDDPADLFFEPATFGLAEGQAYWVREFWQAATRYFSSSDGSGLHLGEIAPHGVRLLAVRPAQNDQPCYLGSELHISQGLEVTGWEKESRAGLKLQLERPGRSQGKIEIYLPGSSPRQATLNGEPITWQTQGQGLYTFDLAFFRSAEIKLAY